MKLLIWIGFVFASLSTFAGGTFIAYQDQCPWDYPQPKNVHYLPPEYYALYKDQVVFDTITKNGHGCFVVWIIENNNIIRHYRLESKAKFTMGNAAPFFKTCSPSNYASASFNYATRIIDSLKSENILYAVSPPIDTRFKYYVSLDLYYKNYPPTAGMGYYEIDSLETPDFFLPLRQKFMDTYPELHTTKIHFDDISHGMLTISFRIDTNYFDFSRLDSLDVYMKTKPRIYDEGFNIQIYQPYN